MTLNLAIVGGDGTGPEVVAEGLRVLKAVSELENFNYTTKDFDFGGERYMKTGEVLSDADIEELKNYDAIFLGAVGHPDVKPGILEKGLLLKMRFDLDQYINLRPVKLYEGIETPLANKTPKDIDFVCVRENTEDLYCGNGGTARKNTPHEISTQEMIATRFGAERCLRYAFDLARSRKAAGYPGILTLVHKTNVLTFCGDTWFRAFNEIGEADYPDIERDYHHVDACCMYMATKPEIYDVVVVPNMFGDIITDLGAAIAGGMGIASSGNINPDKDNNNPSMFEPVHGSSPDIAGQNKANPLAAIDSLAILLQESGRKKDNTTLIKAGERIAKAVQSVTHNFTGKRLDRSGYSTTEIGDMVIAAL
ncbi:3-isopropylmalate dehydrogenase [Poriferisphaera corsica]|uniref:3-isopropylmalate dehydrogenase n=1 Tax=Poriferisphaera corsica TaxID=2528020 RepID=A0A517YZD9_9BACT|nr:3-isopropylmalate dehydrogenase [Poriferisphaera corsica]QDU35592.1 3-isopropylmalate dehydrogenase [Poriferisphaera corsica]